MSLFSLKMERKSSFRFTIIINYNKNVIKCEILGLSIKMVEQCASLGPTTRRSLVQQYLQQPAEDTEKNDQTNYFF